MTVAELIDLLQAMPGDARVVVPFHRAYRDADVVQVRLTLDGAGPGAHERVAGAANAPGSVDAAIICTRPRAAEIREDQEAGAFADKG